MAERRYLSTKQKALAVNLDERFYGSFAEIGAGQETGRHFLLAGAASGTVAKTISAYDMTLSNSIYGRTNRYVAKARLERMLATEYNELDTILRDERGENTQFFSFANTVATKRYDGTGEAHGWVGMRFQHEPGANPSDVVIHVRMLESTGLQQADALGVTGVNLVYAGLFYSEDPYKMLHGFMENLDKGRITINCIQVRGPRFEGVDQRLLNLELVKHDLTNAVLFTEKGDIALCSDEFYKKDIMIARGSYRPPTKVNLDIMKTGLEAFTRDAECESDEILRVAELTITNLRQQGLSNEDFLARVDLINALGFRVLVSNFSEYYRLSSYVARYTKGRIGIVMGVYNFQQIFDTRYTQVEGGIMASLGLLFRENVTLYVYPFKEEEDGDVVNLESLEIEEECRPLLDFIKQGKKVIDLRKFDENLLHIYSRRVLNMISAGESGWEDLLPEVVTKMIKEKKLFGYHGP